MENAIGDVEDAVVVRHDDHGRAALSRQATEEIDHVAPRLLVERRRRLVGEHEAWPADERPRHGHALLLARRELVGCFVAISRPTARSSRGRAPPRCAARPARGGTRAAFCVTVNASRRLWSWKM
jgi:hypothetical protein